MKDTILISRAKQCDPTAFEAIFAHYKNKLDRYLRTSVRSHDDRNEIIQKTFIKVFRSLDTFDTDEDLSPWLFSIADNVRRDFFKTTERRIRRVKNFTDLDDEFRAMIYQGRAKCLSDKNGTPLDHLERKHDGRIAMRLLDELPEGMKLSVKAIVMDGFSSRQAASFIDCSYRQITNRVHKGLERIHDSMSKAA